MKTKAERPKIGDRTPGHRWYLSPVVEIESRGPYCAGLDHDGDHWRVAALSMIPGTAGRPVRVEITGRTPQWRGGGFCCRARVTFLDTDEREPGWILCR